MVENESPATWAKFPWQKAVIVLLSAIITLFGLIIKSARDDKDLANERIEYLRNYIKVREEETKFYQSELYRCKDESAKYFRTQDSVNRAVLDEPVRNLLKQLKR